MLGAAGTIGNSGVLCHAAEKAAARADEAAAYDICSARVSHLVSKVAAVSSQAQTQQYGALLRPLMEGMTRLMVHMVAADGTDREVAAVEAVAEELTAARKARIRGLKAARGEARGGGGDEGAGGDDGGDTAAWGASGGGGATAARGALRAPQLAVDAASVASAAAVQSAAGGQPVSSAGLSTERRASSHQLHPGARAAMSSSSQRAPAPHPPTAGTDTSASRGGTRRGGGRLSSASTEQQQQQQQLVGFREPGSKEARLHASTGRLVAAQLALRTAAERHSAYSQSRQTSSSSRREPPTGSSSLATGVASASGCADAREHHTAAAAPAAATRTWTLVDELAHQRRKVGNEKQAARARKGFPG